MRGVDVDAARRSMDANGHHVTHRAFPVKQLLAIATPTWIAAAAAGYLPLAAGGWKRLNIYLCLAGLIRVVCDPLSVRRKHAILILKRRLKKRNWLARTSRCNIQRQHHQIPTGFSV